MFPGNLSECLYPIPRCPSNKKGGVTNCFQRLWWSERSSQSRKHQLFHRYQSFGIANSKQIHVCVMIYLIGAQENNFASWKKRLLLGGIDNNLIWPAKEQVMIGNQSDCVNCTSELYNFFSWLTSTVSIWIQVLCLHLASVTRKEEFQLHYLFASTGTVSKFHSISNWWQVFSEGEPVGPH